MRLPIFYSALLLTLVNLLLRGVGTSFQVYLSGRIGAAGIGLLQLVMSVNSLALVAGVAGVRTAAMYLTAEELGKKRRENVTWVLSGCFGYSLVCSGLMAAALYGLAPWLAERWIGTPGTEAALRLFACFLPVICLANVMVGYFTAANRIGTLSAVEVAEQLVSMGVTMTALTLYGGSDPLRSCQSVILGSCLASCFTLVCLAALRLLEGNSTASRIPMGKRLTRTALPLAAADVLRSGIGTAENLMVPKRLGLNSGIGDPLAAFGLVSGMVFPVLMFPACILYGLAELLIPELARCAAAGSGKRIRYLVGKSLHLALLYGVAFGGLEYLLADWLCQRLYGSAEAGASLRLYALLIPMLYCDAIVDAMTKGLGQQRACVRYNILTSFLDVVFLWLLLPEYGMRGYFLSFLTTHVINFALSLRRLLGLTGQPLSLRTPLLAGCAAVAAVLAGRFLTGPAASGAAYLLVLGSLLCLFRVTGWEDVRWMLRLIRGGDGRC